jgi:acetyl-CoA carboxylase carboxyl transferase subunit alpha
MLEHSIYSVISPEGCASILWKDSNKMREAADALKLTAQNLKKIGVVDHIVTEPIGGAHRDKKQIIKNVEELLIKEITRFENMSPAKIKKLRTDKFIEMGSISDS